MAITPAPQKDLEPPRQHMAEAWILMLARNPTLVNQVKLILGPQSQVDPARVMKLAGLYGGRVEDAARVLRAAELHQAMPRLLEDANGGDPTKRGEYGRAMSEYLQLAAAFKGLRSQVSATDTTAPIAAGRATEVRKASAADIVKGLLPNAVFAGISVPFTGGGPYVTVSLINGKAAFYGSSPPIATLPDILTPVGVVKASVSVVGLAGKGADGKAFDRGGIGINFVFPTPLGSLVLGANLQQNQLTAGQIADLAQGKPLRDTKQLVGNAYFLYSVSDAAIKALSVVNPSLGATLQQAVKATGGHIYAGLNWGCMVQFDKNGIPSMLVNHKSVSLSDVPRLAKEVLALGKLGVDKFINFKPPVQQPMSASTPAEQDFWGQLGIDLFGAGESPWTFARVGMVNGADGMKFRPSGRPEDRVMQPIYVMAVRAGVIDKDYVIKDNADAGRIIEQTIERARAVSPQQELHVVSCLMNDYGLDFGSKSLKLAYVVADTDRNPLQVRALINSSRAREGIPLVHSGKELPPDFEAVRAKFLQER